MKGKKVHYKCTCTFPIDIVGVIVGFRIESNEIIFKIDTNGKYIEVGENTPKGYMQVLD